ncbi:LysM peptidoglycan-binding domain-containing protein, partial [Bacteroidales bacterium OttesenSCG-928-E04]|nr:LysM peptidoglycan-binding domain-containing protein [Bacteroidales bacterium OttesenSCG-928-E04]
KDDTTSVANNDSLYAVRLRSISTVIPLAYNDKVKRWIELYSEKRKRSSSAMLGLAQYYFPWMKEIFDKYNVPEELIYMTIIESALNPNAVSKAGATGIWQFMYTTGKMYGLEVNTFVDDRRDPYKATDAAARHLRDLYNIFNDWGLAIAAYNCGPANVRKAITRAGGGKHDFWSLSRFLPKETQNYFPAYIGAFYLMEYHNLHGIKPANISIPSTVDTVMVAKELHLEQLSTTLELNYDEVKLLNPQYKRLVVPAFAEPYPLRLKVPDMIRYMELKDSVHAYNYEVYFSPLKVYENQFTGKEDPSLKTGKIYHTVKKGETLSRIANDHHLSVYELKKMNKLTSNTIKIGQRLLVGYKVIEEKKPEDKPMTVAAENEATLAGITADSTTLAAPCDTLLTKIEPQTTYTVQKGDTFYSISKKVGVSPQRLAEYNEITNMNQLSIGQKLKIPLD